MEMNNVPTPITQNQQGFNNGFVSTRGNTWFDKLINPNFDREQDFLLNQQASNLQFQRDLYADSTKYQRAIEDMKKAGINPVMLSGGMNTSGAGMGSGATGGRGSSNDMLGKIVNGLFNITMTALLKTPNAGDKVKAIGFGKK